VTVREISTATDQTVSFFHALAPPLVAIAYMANGDGLFLDALWPLHLGYLSLQKELGRALINGH
jgi:hypothetical protein